MPTALGRLAWAASLPVCVAGWLIAHSLAYRLLASGSESVERTGHGQLAFSPFLMALSLIVLLLALAAAFVAGVRGRPHVAVPLAPFAFLPLVDFVSHLAVESVEHGGALSAGEVLEPVFLAGLALQLPFALAALLLTRTAMAWAEGLGRWLPLRWRPHALVLASPARPRVLIAAEHRPSVPALASGHAGRGPPVSLPDR